MVRFMVWKALIFFSLVLAGCQGFETIEGPFELEVTDRGLEYSGVITLPTPCHSIEKEVSSHEDTVRIDFSVIAPAPEVFCVQVIDEQSVSGRVGIDEESIVEIYVDNALVQRERVI